MDRRALATILTICAAAAVLCLGILKSVAYLNRMAMADERLQAIKEAQLSRDAFALHTLDLVRYVDTFLLGMRNAYLQEHSLTDVRSFVRRVPAETSIITNLTVIGPEGDVLYWSGGASPENLSLADRQYFQVHRAAAEDRIYFASVDIGRLSGKHRFAVSRRITLADGSFGGVVVAAVDPNAVSDLYQELRIGPGSSVSLLGSEDHRLRSRVPVPPDNQWGVFSDEKLWRALQEKEEGVYETRGDGGDGAVTYSFKQLRGYPLVVVVGFSQHDLELRLQGFSQRNRISAGVLIATVILLALLVVMIAVNRQRLALANRDLQAVHEQLRALALYDTLTGLPNRNLLEDRLGHAMLDAERNQQSCAVMYLDLDDFKIVNDRIGHDAGDHVLKVTAKRMLAAVRASDTVSRRGGDEFVILLPHAGTLPEILEIADRLVKWIAEPIDYHGQACTVSASIGVAIYPGAGDTGEALLKAADEAMYVAKNKGKRTIAIAEDASGPPTAV